MEAAAGIIDVVDEHMFGALRLVSVEQGYDPRDFALVAFGGAGPLHANALGALLGSWPVIIPPSPGVLCAYGDATTRLRNEAACTYIRRFSATSGSDVAETLGALGESAGAVLEAEGCRAPPARPSTRPTCVIMGRVSRCRSRSTWPASGRHGIDPVRKAFDEIHRRLFTFNLDVEHEFVNLRAIVQENGRELKPARLAKGGPDPAAALKGETPIWAHGRLLSAKLYDRARLLAHNVLDGPAIVTEMDSTTLILPGHFGEVDAFGNILIRPRQ